VLFEITCRIESIAPFFSPTQRDTVLHFWMMGTEYGNLADYFTA
jgi:hypothetical protein